MTPRRALVLLPIAALAAAALAPASRAVERARTARIVYIGEPGPAWRERIRGWFSERGFVEGRNLDLRYERIGGASPREAEARARSIIGDRPDAIIVPARDMAHLFSGLTREVPLVLMNYGGDPVRLGLVASYREPGGNVTGSSQQLMEMTPKFFEVLKELRPGGRRGGILMVEKSTREKYMEQAREEMARAGAHLGIEVAEVVVPDEPTVGDVRAAIERARIDFLFVPEDLYRKPVMPDVLAYLRGARLPALYINPALVRRGGLVAIWPDWVDGTVNAIEITTRILRGEKPATIPLYRVLRYSLAINRGTARAMGLEVPASLLLGAEEVVD